VTPATGRAPRAELRTLRLCTGVVGATTLAGTIATSYVIAQPARITVPVTVHALTVVAVVLPLLAAVTAPWVGLRTLRRVNALVVVEYAAVLLVLALATVGGRVGGSEVPWLLTFTAAPVTAALVAWGRRVAVGVLLGATGAIQLLRLLADGDRQAALASDIQVFFASSSVVLLFGILVEASREFDRSTEEAYAGASRRAAQDARAAVHRRVQGVVHDEVLAVLVLAAQDAPALRAAVAAQAARARRLLGDLRRPDAAARVPVDQLARELAELVTKEAPDARLAFADLRRAAPDAAHEVGADVAEAFAGALRQALVNSLTHAGPEAVRSVEITAGDDGLRVVVEDDGVGFDPATVPPTRMGISISVLGRMRGAPGCDGWVASQPGAGTRVTLRWTPGAERPADEPIGPGGLHSPDDGLAGILPATSGRLRQGFLVTIGAFLGAQAVLAFLAVEDTAGAWVGELALAGVALAFLACGWSSLGVPSAARARLVAALVLGISALTLVPVQRDPHRYGDTWYVAAGGFVLLVLAVRGRPGTASVGGLLAVALAVTGARVQANDVADVLASSTRHAVILAVAVLLVLGIGRIRARTRRLRAAELDAVRAGVFREAAAVELRERSRALSDLIGRMLGRLERGTPLTDAERRECSALDGRLRDEYRGGRISRPPMIEVAMAARRRGVDVVLLDDAPDRVLTDAELDEVVHWLADRLAAVPAGRFTGRILPEGRAALASAVAGEEVAELRHQPGDLGSARLVGAEARVPGTLEAGDHDHAE
jgi:signal transduction histidine kinase